MLVTKLMSKNVVSVGLDTRLKVLVEVFSKHHFHHLLVVERRVLVGVVSDRDLLRALTPNAGIAISLEKDNACLAKPVNQIMSRDPIVISESESIIAAVKLVNQFNLSVLAVLDKRAVPVGILLWRDTFRSIERAYA